MAHNRQHNTGRVMELGYWLARNPGKTEDDYNAMLSGMGGSAGDAGGGAERSALLNAANAESATVGGGYGKHRIGEESRGQMDLTKNKKASILTSPY